MSYLASVRAIAPVEIVKRWRSPNRLAKKFYSDLDRFIHALRDHCFVFCPLNKGGMASPPYSLVSKPNAARVDTAVKLND